MKATIEISYNELNKDFVEVLLFLFENNIHEITLKRKFVKLEEFDKNLDTKQVMEMLKQGEYNENLLKKIEKELQNIETPQK